MPSSVAFDLESYRSVHCDALEQLAIEKNSLPWWPKGYPRLESLAFEPLKVQFYSGFYDGDESVQLRYVLDAGITADLLHSCYLEVRVPQLQASTETTLPSYVWGLGYSLFERARFVVNGEVLEDLTSTYLEMHEELMSPAGQTFQEATWKFDGVTIPELSKLSQQQGGCILYVPLRFFWTKGGIDNCVLPIKSLLSGSDDNKKDDEKPTTRMDLLKDYFNTLTGSRREPAEIKIVVQLRRIEDVCYELPQNNTETNVGVPKPVGKDTALEWSDFVFNLWVGGIFLEPESDTERYFLKETYTAVISTPEYLSKNDEGEPIGLNGTLAKPIPFRLPSKCLLWSVADQSRLTRTISSGTSNDPYANDVGVRSLFGTRSSHVQTIADRNFTSSAFDAVSYENIKAYITDWNAVKDREEFSAITPGEFAILPIYTAQDTDPIDTTITIRMPTGELLGQYALQLAADNTITRFEQITPDPSVPNISPPPPDFYPFEVMGYYPLFNTEEGARTFAGSGGNAHLHPLEKDVESAFYLTNGTSTTLASTLNTSSGTQTLTNQTFTGEEGRIESPSTLTFYDGATNNVKTINGVTLQALYQPNTKTVSPTLDLLVSPIDPNVKMGDYAVIQRPQFNFDDGGILHFQYTKTNFDGFSTTLAEEQDLYGVNSISEDGRYMLPPGESLHSGFADTGSIGYLLQQNHPSEFNHGFIARLSSFNGFVTITLTTDEPTVVTNLELYNFYRKQPTGFGGYSSGFQVFHNLHIDNLIPYEVQFGYQDDGDASITWLQTATRSTLPEGDQSKVYDINITHGIPHTNWKFRFAQPLNGEITGTNNFPTTSHLYLALSSIHMTGYTLEYYYSHAPSEPTRIQPNLHFPSAPNPVSHKIVGDGIRPYRFWHNNENIYETFGDVAKLWDDANYGNTYNQDANIYVRLKEESTTIMENINGLRNAPEPIGVVLVNSNINVTNMIPEHEKPLIVIDLGRVMSIKQLFLNTVYEMFSVEEIQENDDTDESYSYQSYYVSDMLISSGDDGVNFSNEYYFQDAYFEQYSQYQANIHNNDFDRYKLYKTRRIVPYNHRARFLKLKIDYMGTRFIEGENGPTSLDLMGFNTLFNVGITSTGKVYPLGSIGVEAHPDDTQLILQSFPDSNASIQIRQSTPSLIYNAGTSNEIGFLDPFNTQATFTSLYFDNPTNYYMPGSGPNYTQKGLTLYHNSFTSYPVDAPATVIDRARRNYGCVGLADVIGGEKLRGILLEQQETSTEILAIPQATPDTNTGVFGTYLDAEIGFTETGTSDIRGLIVLANSATHGLNSYVEVAEHLIYTSNITTAFDQLSFQRNVSDVEQSAFADRSANTTSASYSAIYDILTSSDWFSSSYVNYWNNLQNTLFNSSNSLDVRLYLDNLWSAFNGVQTDSLTQAFFTNARYTVYTRGGGVYNNNYFGLLYFNEDHANNFYVYAPSTQSLSVSLTGLGPSGLSIQVGSRSIPSGIVNAINHLASMAQNFIRNMVIYSYDLNHSNIINSRNSMSAARVALQTSITTEFNSQSGSKKTIYAQTIFTINTNAQIAPRLTDYASSTTSNKIFVRTSNLGSTDSSTRFIYNNNYVNNQSYLLNSTNPYLSLQRLAGNPNGQISGVTVGYDTTGGVLGVNLEFNPAHTISPVTTGITPTLTNQTVNFLGVRPMNVQLTTAGLESISSVFGLLSPIRYFITSSSSDLRFDVVPITQAQLAASSNPAEYVPPPTEDGLGNLLTTSNDVRQHRNDGLNACPFLHMNRWDYRACTAHGNEAEPLERIRLKLANEPRWHADLESQPLYFRAGVQAPLHFPRIPRKGIYAYSFAKEADKNDEGFSHFGKLHNKKLELSVNKASSTLSRLHMFNEGLNVFECNPKEGTARLLQNTGND